MELILCRIVASSCSLTHNIAPHISLHDPPYHTTMKKYEDFEGMRATRKSCGVFRARLLSSHGLLWSHLWSHFGELPTASSRLGCTGVLWVLMGPHPCGPPPRQDGEGTRAPALVYVHAVCVYVAYVVASVAAGFVVYVLLTPALLLGRCRLRYRSTLVVKSATSVLSSNRTRSCWRCFCHRSPGRQQVLWTLPPSPRRVPLSSAWSTLSFLAISTVFGSSAWSTLSFLAISTVFGSSAWSALSFLMISTGGSAAGSAVVSSVGNSSWFSARSLLTPSATCLLISLSEHSRC